MYPSDQVRAGYVMPFCHPRTEFPGRIEASRGNRNWKLEAENQKFGDQSKAQRPGWGAPIWWPNLSDDCKSSI